MENSWINKYTEIVEPCDIVLIGNNKSFISKLICWGQKVHTIDDKPSLWSHCMLAIDKSTVGESTIDFKKYIDGYKLHNGTRYTSITEFQDSTQVLLISLPLSDEQKEKVLNKADEIISKHYTYPILGLLGSLLSYYIFNWKSNPLQTKHSLYCSAFIQEIFLEVGYDFSQHHTSRNTSVEMIARYECENIEKIRIL